MKELTVTGIDGAMLAKFLVNVEGDNVSYNMNLPMFLPVVSINLLDIEKKENKRIRAIIKQIKAMVS